MALNKANPIATLPETAGAGAGMKHMQLLADYPDLLTVKHLHELTGLSEQTIRSEINNGRIPGCRIGRRLFVPKTRFIEFIDCKGEL